MSETAILVLEDGYFQVGTRYGAAGHTFGEIIFSTAMTGYQEAFTDPANHGHIVVMTSPHIGNTGVNPEDAESSRFWIAGLVVRDPARRASNWQATGELEDELTASGIVGIAGVDTRAITRHLRDAGSMRAGIFAGDAVPAGAAAGEQQALEVLIDLVRQHPGVEGQQLTAAVSTIEGYTIEPSDGPAEPLTVVAVDLGITSRTPAHLAARGCRVRVVPQSITLAELMALAPDGVLFSNGPGDPAAALHEIELLRGLLDARVPFMGIGLGNQLLGRALGFGTFKLPFGHRGVSQPVRELATGTVLVATHNHSFAVDAPSDGPVVTPFGGGQFGRAEVSHISLNDGVVEGLRCLDRPAFAVQYLPENAAGPLDAPHLFDQFISLMTSAPRAKENA